MSNPGGAAAREMPIIHRIFRRQLAEVRALVQEAPAADETRVGAVADHLGFLLDGLHIHHTTEDQLIWPKLLDRAGLDAPLVERMAEQHQQIDASVAVMRATMSTWRSDSTPASSAALAHRIGEFLVVLEEHLDEEEQVVVPLIDRHLTEAEWQGGRQARLREVHPGPAMDRHGTDGRGRDTRGSGGDVRHAAAAGQVALAPVRQAQVQQVHHVDPRRTARVNTGTP